MISCHMLVAKAQAAVPSAYSSIVSISVRLRPMRSRRTEHDAARAPSRAAGCELRIPVQYGSAALRFRRADRQTEQRRHGVGRDEVEQQAVEDVEAPAQPGREQHGPLVARQFDHGARV